MQRFLIALALVVVACATYVATAPGSQTAAPTAAQFKALKKQVSKLQKDEKLVKNLALVEAVVITDCMATAVAIRPYGDYANPTGPTYGYSYSDPSINSGTPFPETALNLTAGDDPQAGWMSVGTSACLADLGTARHKLARLGGIHLQAAPHSFSAVARH